MGDPDVYKVVDEVIKPATEAAGVGYALWVNPHGLAVQHFLSHAWAERFKRFSRDIIQWVQQDAAHRDGGLWICFLANPQAWDPYDLNELLGNQAYLSPFVRALDYAQNFIVV